jgi:DnaJ-class molecular chaperone
MPKDYYIVLGITPSADAKKIKKAYRTVAKKYHPDVSHSPESAERFQEIREAYETLSDEGARRRYDKELTREGSSLRITKVPETIERRRSVFDEMDSVFSHVDDFFSGFLPGFFDRERRLEKDLFLEAILSPGEAIRGGLFPVTVPVIEPCTRCSKRGIWEEFFCPVCSGYGRIRSERDFSISIPPNVQHGTEIRLSMEDIGLKDAYLNIVVYIDPDLEEAS